jgi:hypothetical protein
MSDPVLDHLTEARNVVVAKERQKSLIVLAIAIACPLALFILSQVSSTAESGMEHVDRYSRIILTIEVVVLSLMAIFSGWFYSIVLWNDAISEYKKAVSK